MQGAYNLLHSKGWVMRSQFHLWCCLLDRTIYSTISTRENLQGRFAERFIVLLDLLVKDRSCYSTVLGNWHSLLNLAELLEICTRDIHEDVTRQEKTWSRKGG